MTPSREADAVRQFREHRSEDAFRLLYRAHTPYLWAFALRLCAGRSSEAEEALQEAWIRAAERLGRFGGESVLRTWLAGIVFNCCREQHRRRAGTAAAAAGEPSTWRSPESAFADERLDLERLDLERAVAALPEGQREILLLHHFQGFTHEEIARLTGIPSGTSKSRLFEARRTLRRRLSATPRSMGGTP